MTLVSLTITLYRNDPENTQNDPKSTLDTAKSKKYIKGTSHAL